jgi:hypothetical protein
VYRARQGDGETKARRRIIVVVAVFASMFCGAARAGMSITPQGAAQGFSLSTFATGFPVLNNAGPTGIVFLDGGGILISDQPGNVRLFSSDADGQDASTIPVSQNYGAGNNTGLTRIGTAIYMTQYVVGKVARLNTNGAFVGNVAPVTTATGIVPNPTTGHLYVASFDKNQVLDVNPASGAVQSLISSPKPDGLVLSADGAVLYVAAAGVNSLRGYSTTTGAQVYDSGALTGVPDGVVLGAGAFAGLAFVNTNNGQLIEVDLTTNSQTLIATGGSRGDFVTVDPTNGTLLITQSDRILRMQGGTFVPEPGTLSLIGLCVMALLFRRKPG